MLKHKELFYHYDKMMKKLKNSKQDLYEVGDNHINKISNLGIKLLYDSFIYLSNVINDDSLSKLSLIDKDNEENDGKRIISDLSYSFDTDKGKFKVSLIETYENHVINKFATKVHNELNFSLIKLGNKNKDTFQNKDVVVSKYNIYDNMISDIDVNDFPYELLDKIVPNIIYKELYKEIKYKDGFNYDNHILIAQQNDYIDLIE